MKFISLVGLLSAFLMAPYIARAAIPAPQPAASASATVPDPFELLRPKVKLGKKLDIFLQPHPPLTNDLTAKIKQSIADLAQIDSPDYGFSPTLSGSAFAPIPGAAHSDMMLLTDHKLKSSEAFRALVEAGPDALPFLLDALDDKTPTKLIIKHDLPMGGMWFAEEISQNPINELETKVLAQANQQVGPEKGRTLQTYTVRVGDLCFAAIGEIVGRPYQAIRYQPTAITIINSP
ncbi:MAG TPA: hypothetical protein VGN88_07300, partial [Phycisphaerae bacterium]